MRLVLVLVVGLVLLSSHVDAAEKQIKPFVAVTFGGGTTLLDLEDTSARSHPAIGVGGAMLWDLFGFDVDLAHVPGVFQSKNQTLVLDSSVTTLTGSFIITLPRRMTEYVLRPYFVGGGGLMRVRIDDVFEALPVRKTLPTSTSAAGRPASSTTDGACPGTSAIFAARAAIREASASARSSYHSGARTWL